MPRHDSDLQQLGMAVKARLDKYPGLRDTPEYEALAHAACAVLLAKYVGGMNPEISDAFVNRAIALLKLQQSKG